MPCESFPEMSRIFELSLLPHLPPLHQPLTATSQDDGLPSRDSGVLLEFTELLVKSYLFSSAQATDTLIYFVHLLFSLTVQLYANPPFFPAVVQRVMASKNGFEVFSVLSCFYRHKYDL